MTLDVAQLPASLDIGCVVGNDLTVSFVVTESGAAKVWTNVAVAAWVTDTIGTTLATFTDAQPEAGALTLALTDTQTTAIGVGMHRWMMDWVTSTTTTQTVVGGEFRVYGRHDAPGQLLTSTTNITVTNSSVALSVTASIGGVGLTSATPAAVGVAAVGSSITAARGDHVHAAAASAVSVTPAGTITADDVQEALVALAVRVTALEALDLWEME